MRWTVHIKGGVPCSRLHVFSHRPKRTITKLSCFPCTFADIPQLNTNQQAQACDGVPFPCVLFLLHLPKAVDLLWCTMTTLNLNPWRHSFEFLLHSLTLFKLRPDHIWMLFRKMMQLCTFLNHRVLWNLSSCSSPPKRGCFHSVMELPADTSHAATLWAHESLGCPGTSFQKTAFKEYTTNVCLMQKVAKLSFNHYVPQTVVTSLVLWFHPQNGCQRWMFVNLTWLVAVRKPNHNQLDVNHHAKFPVLTQTSLYNLLHFFKWPPEAGVNWPPHQKVIVCTKD